MKSKRVNYSILLVLILILFSGRPVWCHASKGAPEKNAERTLEVVLVFTDDSESVPVAGAKVQVSRIADLVKNKGNYQYKMTHEYAGSGVDINTVKKASESLKAAEKLDQYRQKKKLGVQSGVTDSEGTVSFSFKKPGIYLVSQNGWNISNAKYTEFSPYLVKLPMPDSDDPAQITKWEDYVVTEPKVEIKKKGTEPGKGGSVGSVETEIIQGGGNGYGKDTGKGSGTIRAVKTGDDTDWYLPLSLMAGSLLLFLILLIKGEAPK
ncbi:MAG: hypothetical protein ACI4CZ_04090 [Hominisplanchenecus sp.]